MENPLEPGVPNIAPPGDNAARTPPSLTRLRTYKDDIASAVQDSNMSAAKIFLAEEERRHNLERAEEAASPETPKNRLTLAISGFLILAAIAGFVFFRFLYTPAAPPEITIDVPDFIRSDRRVEVAAGERSYRDVQADLRRIMSAPVPAREIYRIVPSEAREVAASQGDASIRQISSEQLFGAIGAYPPGEVARALEPDFFIGVYGSSGKGPIPFIIFETESPALARGAMLAWEETMAADLAPLFPEADGYVRVTANQPVRRVPWADAVYQNRDARVLSVGDEEILLWGFGDNGAIIIASDPFLLPEMASRLARDRELH
jgi:hypothetical protein